ncbi:hypothetical protein KQX54_002630 [Cotesia glomerata]|uniref:Uncharacterized protein n=1 Tax=Cotesia glomerata TaxID=32391 RepID=A0AAV7IF23_COTGL|nr:hypothetical protein KQX54_002630 [Cotesia glomerata]
MRACLGVINLKEGRWGDKDMIWWVPDGVDTDREFRLWCSCKALVIFFILTMKTIPTFHLGWIKDIRENEISPGECRICCECSSPRGISMGYHDYSTTWCNLEDAKLSILSSLLLP